MKRAGLAVAATLIAATGFTVDASAAPGHAVLTFAAAATETSGLNAQGVPGKLGGTGTIELVLRNAKGTVAGTLSAEVVVTSRAYPSTTLQIATARLAGGTLAVEGVQAENQTSATLAIVGGTGKYEGAGGTARVVSGAHGTTITFSIVGR